MGNHLISYNKQSCSEYRIYGEETIFVTGKKILSNQIYKFCTFNVDLLCGKLHVCLHTRFRCASVSIDLSKNV